jgi:hypothetical protein
LKSPFWFPKKDNAIVYLVFIVIFLLSLDFWGWGQSKPMFLGMPLWVYYLIIITLLTSVAFYILAKYYWRDSK